MRSLLAPVLAVALTASGAFADTAGPLPAGKPAGVQQAHLGSGIFLLLGVAAVAAGIAFAVTNNNDNAPVVTTTTTG